MTVCASCRVVGMCGMCGMCGVCGVCRAGKVRTHGFCLLCALEEHTKQLFRVKNEFFPRDIFLNLQRTPHYSPPLDGSRDLIATTTRFPSYFPSLLFPVEIGDFRPFAQEDAHVRRCSSCALLRLLCVV